MDILERQISFFESTTETEVSGALSIEEVLSGIETGEWKSTVNKLREGNKEEKKRLPTFAMHGIFEHSRKSKNFIEASGLIILDIDDVDIDLIQDTKEELMTVSPHILAVMTSPSGNGIKLLYYVSPEQVTQDSYRMIGKTLVSKFSEYGHVDFLSVTDCLIATYDPEILINEDAEPDFVFIQEEVLVSKKTLEERDESLNLWTNVEDFFETVLAANIEEKTNNNYHFIQVAILDLAKFGFKHPEDDLKFVIDYAESAFKVSPENHKRFLEIVEIAKAYPQTQWAYKTFDDEEEADDYNDYSQYIESKKDKEVNSEATEEADDAGGLIDYKDLFDRVNEVILEGDRVGKEVSMSNFAEAFRFKGTGIFTFTGIPGHGKTEFVDALTLDLARLHGEETIIAGFEQSPEQHIIKLIRKMIGADITCPTWINSEENKTTLREAYEFVIKHFKHIDINKSGGDINKLLDVAAEQISKSRDEGGNPRYVVFDPFNMMSIKGKVSGHEKIEEILRRITHFSHQMDVMIILVAHPFKMRKDEKTGEYDVPDFYSVKGSSAFFEMSYHGATIYRRPDGIVMVKILKVKQNNMGTTGSEVFFLYEKAPGRYIPVDEEGNELSGDHRDKDWLKKSSEKFF